MIVHQASNRFKGRFGEEIQDRIKSCDPVSVFLLHILVLAVLCRMRGGKSPRNVTAADVFVSKT